MEYIDIITSVNNINIHSIKNRIKKELTQLVEDDCISILSITFEKNEVDLLIITMVDMHSTNAIIYEFYIPKSYPFSIPKVKINNESYSDFLKIKTCVFLHLLKQIKSMNCLCCNSYLCGDYWSPITTIKKFIEEIRMFRKNRRDIVNKYYADMIKDMYLIQDVNLDEWLF